MANGVHRWQPGQARSRRRGERVQRVPDGEGTRLGDGGGNVAGEESAMEERQEETLSASEGWRKQDGILGMWRLVGAAGGAQMQYVGLQEQVRRSVSQTLQYTHGAPHTRQRPRATPKPGGAATGPSMGSRPTLNGYGVGARGGADGGGVAATDGTGMGEADTWCGVAAEGVGMATGRPRPGG